MKDATAIVNLGRSGDLLLGALPVAFQLHLDSGDQLKVPVFVSRDYAGVLDGASYIEPIVLPMRVDELPAAIDRASKEYTQVLIPQCWGAGYQYMPQFDSFSVDSIAKCGMLDRWASMPLVIDNRSHAREQALVSKYVESPTKRLVLVGGTGHSSPWRHAIKPFDLASKLRQTDVQILNLDLVKAERIFDVLALMERASAILTVDTSWAHLAWSCPTVPLILLQADSPSMWHGTRPRHNCVLNLRYGEWEARMGEVLEALAYYSSAVPTRLIHLYSSYVPGDVDARRRQSLAMTSWHRQYALNTGWVSNGVLDRTLPRMFNDGIRQLPYVRDLFDRGCDGESDSAIIVFANADCMACPSFTSRLLARFNATECVYSHRRDLGKIDRLLDDSEVKLGAISPGYDLFAFRASWWRAHRHELPDFVIGAEWWDEGLRHLMLKTTRDGIDIRFDDLIAHQQHAATWEQPHHRRSLPSQRHNTELAKGFFFAQGVTWLRFQPMVEGPKQRVMPTPEPSITAQGLAVKILTTHDTNKASELCYFNAGLCHAKDGRVFGIARESRNGGQHGREHSRIVVFDYSRFDVPLPARQVIISPPHHPDEHLEDARLVQMPDGNFMVSYCFQVPGSQKCGQRISVFKEGWHHLLTVTPPYGSRVAEKNWTVFFHNGIPHIVYRPNIILRVDSLQPWKHLEIVNGAALTWPFGEIRGGTPPVLVGDEYFTFSHSSIEWAGPGLQRRYVLLAYAFEAKPPFKPTRITSAPLLKGSENDSRVLGGPPCVFACGAILRDNVWTVVGGCNDEAVFELALPHDELVKRMVNL